MFPPLEAMHSDSLATIPTSSCHEKPIEVKTTQLKLQRKLKDIKFRPFPVNEHSLEIKGHS